MTDTTFQITDEERQEIVRQIGANILAISGGRVRPIADGIELPVGSGYLVRVHLIADEYTVERVFKRGAKEWIKGSRGRVDCFEIAEVAYYASCFRSYDEGDWEYRG